MITDENHTAVAFYIKLLIRSDLLGRVPLAYSDLLFGYGLDQGEKRTARRVLRDKTIRLALGGCLPIFWDIARQDDDNDVRIAYFDLLVKLKPTLSRQTNIHKNDIGAKGINFGEDFSGIRFFLKTYRWKPDTQSSFSICRKPTLSSTIKILRIIV